MSRSSLDKEGCEVVWVCKRTQLIKDVAESSVWQLEGGLHGWGPSRDGFRARPLNTLLILKVLMLECPLPS